MIYIESKMDHCVSELICIKCGKRWIGVRPLSTLLKDIECPNCGKGFVIETGQVLDYFPCIDCKHKKNGKCSLRIMDYENCSYYERVKENEGSIS